MRSPGHAVDLIFITSIHATASPVLEFPGCIDMSVNMGTGVTPPSENAVPMTGPLWEGVKLNGPPFGETARARTADVRAGVMIGEGAIASRLARRTVRRESAPGIWGGARVAEDTSATSPEV
jgi:hypothetical protein